MSIPLTVTLFDPGPNGVPTTNNPLPLRTLDSYDHSIVNEVGFEGMTTKYRTSLVAAVDMLNRLMASVVVTNPLGRPVWEGYVAEVQLDLGNKTVVVSLADMANRIRVRYSTDTGAQSAASVVQSAASIARYGTKDRLINFGTTTAAAAANRASVVLNQIAYPRCKQRSAAKTGAGAGGSGVTVTLVCRGWWDALDWLLLTNSSTTVTATTTQVVTLLGGYNAINAFFSTSAANITASGVSDTEYVEGDSTYAEKITALLAAGNASQQRLAWGCYEDRAIAVRTWAGATPGTITYTQSAADHTIRDAYGNVVEPWDVRPDAMVQLVDLIEPAPAAGPIDTITRQYIKRVSVRLDRASRTLTLEPDDVDSLEELLTRPAGRGASGSSARQAAIERTIARPARTRFSPTNGRVDLGGGSIDTGGGSIDLGSGGGTITLPGGGGTVTLPPPGGGGSTLLDGSGTAGQLAKWSDADTLTNATAGTDYATAGHTHTPSGTGLAPIDAKYIVQQSNSDLTNEQALGALATGLLKNTTTTGVLSIAVAGTDYVAPSALDELIDDRVGALLVAGNLITLTYNDAGNSLTIAVSSLNETIDDRVAALLVAGTGISLSYNDAGNALTISSTGGTVGGSGTAGRLMQWASGGADAENSTLIKSGAGVLTLSAASTQTITISGSGGGTLALAGGTLTLGPNLTTSGAGGTLTLSAGGSYTLTVPATGTAALGTGTTEQIAYWSGTNTLGNAPIYYDVSNNRIGIKDSTPSYDLDVNATMRATSGISAGSPSTGATGGQVRAQGRIQTDEFFESAAGYRWDLGTYTSGGTITPAQGRVSISINGTTYFLLARTS